MLVSFAAIAKLASRKLATEHISANTTTHREAGSTSSCNFLCTRLKEERGVFVAVATVSCPRSHKHHVRPCCSFLENKRDVASPQRGSPPPASFCTSDSGGTACASPSPVMSPSQLATHTKTLGHDPDGGLYPDGELVWMEMSQGSTLPLG